MANSNMEHTSVRKGMFSIDASFAVVILLMMSYFFFLILDSLNLSLDSLQQRQKTASLVVFSDEIVRREAAVATNTEVISNRISIARLDDYFDGYLLKSGQSSYGFDRVRVSVIGIGGPVYFDREVVFHDRFSASAFCIDRIITIDAGAEETAGILKMCVS